MALGALTQTEVIAEDTLTPMRLPAVIFPVTLKHPNQRYPRLQLYQKRNQRNQRNSKKPKTKNRRHLLQLRVSIYGGMCFSLASGITYFPCRLTLLAYFLFLLHSRTSYRFVCFKRPTTESAPVIFDAFG